MNALKKWITTATPKERETLARLAKTTVGSLYQLAGGYRSSGKVRATPALARRIELGTQKMAEAKGGRQLPVVLREELCPACSLCEFAKRCRV